MGNPISSPRQAHEPCNLAKANISPQSRYGAGDEGIVDACRVVRVPDLGCRTSHALIDPAN